jgi:hypothetical protein
MWYQEFNLSRLYKDLQQTNTVTWITLVAQCKVQLVSKAPW